MLTRIKQVLSPPVFEDNEVKTRQADMLNTVFLGTIGLAIILCLIIAVTGLTWFRLVFAVLWIPMGLTGLWLVHRGYLKLSAISFSVISWLIVTLIALFSGGIRTPGFSSYPTIIFMGGLLGGTYVGLVLGGLSVLSGVGLLYAENNGILPAPLILTTSSSTWAGLTINFVAATVLIHLVIRKIYNTLARARRSEKNFRALAENANDGIAIISGEAVVVYANRRCAELSGYPTSELVGAALAKLVHPGEYERVTARYRQRLMDQPAPNQYETVLIHKDGHDVTIELTAARTVWQGEPAVIAVFRDIDERKQIEAARQQAERRYRELFEEAPAMYVITRNQKGMPLVADCNNLFLSVLNYSRDEVIGRPLADFYSPQSRTALLAEGGYQRALDGSFVAEERQLVCRDGQLVETLLRARPEMTANGHVSGTRAMFVDISERKRAEAELEQYQQHLEARVTERTEELSRANDQLRQAISRRQQVEESLWASQQLLQSTLDALTANLAVLDQAGTIIAVNRSWRQFAVENGLAWTDAGVGRNYLAVIEATVGESAEEASEAGAAIRALITGRRDRFWLEYPCHSPHEKRWFTMRGTRFQNQGGVRVVLAHENVTEQKRAEEALRQSEQRYRTLVEAADDAILLLDLEFNHLLENTAYFTSLGYEPGARIDSRELDSVHPDDRPLLESTMAELLAAGRATSEYRVKHKDGHWVYRLAKSVVIYDEANQPEAILSIIRDITHRKQTEEQLRYLANLVENVSDAIISTDLDFKVKSWNKAAETMYGWSQAEVMGKSLAEITRTEDPDSRPEDVVEALFAQGYWQGEASQACRDGTLLQVSSSVSLLRDNAGQPIGVVAVNQDITERKRAEEALGESEERLQAVFDNVPVLVAVVDSNARFSQVNRQATEMLGYSAAELLQMGPADITYPDDVAETNSFLQRLFAGEISRFRLEKRYLHKDGRVIWGEAAVTPIRTKTDETGGVVEVMTDITERKQAEETLQQRNRELIMLNRTGQAFNSTLDLDHVLGTVLEEMQHLLNVTAASFWLIEPETGELVCRQARGPGSATIMGWRLEPGQGVAGWVAATGQTYLVPDTTLDERHFKGVDQQIGLTFRSILSIPLRARDQVIGVLNLVDTAAGRFSADDLIPLELLVDSAGIAIENARLHAAVQAELVERERAEAALRQLNEALEQRVEERTQALRAEIGERQRMEEWLTTIYRLGQELTLLHDETVIVKRVLKTAAAILRLNMVGCGLVDEAAGELEYRYYAGTMLRARRIRLPLAGSQEASLVGVVVDSRQPASVADAKQDGSPIFFAGTTPVRSELCVPMQVGDRIVGVLDAGSTSPHYFTPADQRLLQTLADQAAVTLENARLQSSLEQGVEELTMLLEAYQVISATVDLHDLHLLTDYVIELLDATAAALVLHDPVRADLWIAAVSGPSSALLQGRRLPWGRGIVAWAIEHGQAVLLPQVSQEPRFYDGFDREFNFVTGALLAVPLQVKGRTLGAIAVVKRSNDPPFDVEDRRLLSLLATPLATTIENLRLFEAEQSRYREAEALRQAALALTSTVVLGDLLNRILTELRVVIPYDSGSVLLLKDNYLEIISSQGFDESLAVKGLRLPLGDKHSANHQVISSLKPVIIPDVKSGPLTLFQATPGSSLIRSWLGVPLVVRDHPIGMITLDKYQPDFYTETHAQTALAYAAQAAVALDNARLYQDLQDQMQALQAAQSQLVQSERMAALGRLMASIGHEINNPLQAVQGFLSLLDEELDGQRRQDKLDLYLGIAGQEIERISDIVNRMRRFYRPSAGEPLPTADALGGFYLLAAVELERVDLHLVLENVLQLAHKKLQHSQITVERQWAAELPAIQASTDYLKQVFLNLTLNAIDAMPEQGGRLRIRTEPDQVQLSGEQPQPVVRLEFSDTGAGMPPEVLPRLFEPLFSTKEHGSGFGLFTSYQIITAHHGQITAASQLGQGTTFTILLPVTQPRREPPAIELSAVRQ